MRYLKRHFLPVSLLIAGTIVTSATNAPGGGPCGITIGPGQSVTLTDDIGPCDTDAGPIAVTVDSGTLDMNGFAVTCADIAPIDGSVAQGILVTGSRAVVRNGTVEGCDGGITLAGTGRHSIAGVTVNLDRAAGFRVVVNSEKNLIAGCVAENNVGNCYEIAGDKTTLTDSIARYCQEGVEIFSAKNKIVGTHATFNSVGYTILGMRNKLTGNLADNNDFMGYQIGGFLNTFQENTADANGAEGFAITNRSKLIKNIATGNAGSGILVLTGPETRSPFIRNTSTGNAVVAGYDLEDLTPDCGLHRWRNNVFGTASVECIE